MSKKIWNPVLDIPEGKIEGYELRHIIKPPSSVLMTANIRTAVMGGHRGESLKFEDETRWHELSYEGGVWMTDLPIEQAQHDVHLEGFAGRILVGGLGVGYAVTQLCERPEVKEVVCVEISPEVIDLVAPHIAHPKLTIVNEPLEHYLGFWKGKVREKTPDDLKFDWAFYDIWQSDGESTFFSTVVPLREHSQGIVLDEQVVCWNEDIMRGQLVSSLRGRLLCVTNAEMTKGKGDAPDLDYFCEEDEGKGAHWHNWTRRFFLDLRDEKFDKDDYNFVRLYAGTYGRPGWSLNWKMTLEELKS